MRDLGKANAENGWAVFLPAISGFYTGTVARAKIKPGYMPDNRLPAAFTNGVDTFDFLDPDKGAFFYNTCLYSAGHAYLDTSKSDIYESMVQNRDKSVICVGDSGGFQVGKGIIKFDWERFYEKPGDPGYVGDADKIRLKIINWLEHTADWSMTLDVPAWATDGNRLKEIERLEKLPQTPEITKEIDKQKKKLTGLLTFDDALQATLYNLDYFQQHRQGKTKYLNVLQGTTWEDCTIWYDAVKNYPFEGWAMGGNNARDTEIILRRLIVMRDEGYLQDRDWIHVLGTSKLDWACMLTAIQRQIRKHVNPNLTISFDCASPFISAANALVYSHNITTTTRFSYVMQSGVDHKVLHQSKIPFPFKGEVGDRLTMGDICWYGNAYATINGVKQPDVTEDEVLELQKNGVDAEWIPAGRNKIDKVPRTSWDTFSYAFLMMHNVEMHIRAVQQANTVADIEHAKHRPDWRMWKKTRRSDTSCEISSWVPVEILYFMSFVEELFESKDPHSLLDQAKDFLLSLDNKKHKDTTGDTMFESLFEIPSADMVDEIDDRIELDESKLDQLETSQRE